jgi:hypothetical protein
MILILGIIVFAGWRVHRKQAMLACVVSIHQGLINLNLTKSDLPYVKSEWTVLDVDGSDREKLIVQASKTQECDCSTVNFGRPDLDYWGRPLEVGARRLPSGKLEYRVWSKGEDGESGTADDLVSPYGEKAVSR